MSCAKGMVMWQNKAYENAYVIQNICANKLKQYGHSIYHKAL